ncbi:MAG: two-component system, cell cycle response regulator [Frankiales bacterium]|nr:two-component system, cell cycle response regulator [Frankiales bacterium]
MSGATSTHPGSVVLGGSLLGRLRAPFSDPSVDTRVRQARLGSGLYTIGFSVAAMTIPFTPASVHKGWMWILVAVAACMAALLLLLPWQRWSDRAILIPIYLGMTIIGAGVGGLAHGLLYYLPLYGLTFVFAGVTRRPGTPIVMAPYALLVGSTAILTGESGTVFVPLVIMVGIGSMLGEVIARYVEVQRIAGDTLDELLMGVAGLTGCRSVAEATDLGSAVLLRLLGADVAVVVLPETAGSTRFVFGGGSGRPEDTDTGRGQVVMDTALEPSGIGLAMLHRRMVFVPDARASELVQQSWLEEMDIASVIYLPLFGRPGAPAGVAIAGFRRHRRSVDAITARGLNLLAEATGRVIDQLRQAEQLVRDADTDVLTGLSNRRVFFRELTTIGEGDALVFVDLDHFKDVNDTLGHAAGDRELAAFGAALREQVRESDIAARYGGEEFAVLVRGRGRAGADLLVNRLREAWGRRSSTTFSAGAALHEGAVQPHATLAAADRAVYLAKATGRDRMCWSDRPESFASTMATTARLGSFGVSGHHPGTRHGDGAASA